MNHFDSLKNLQISFFVFNQTTFSFEAGRRCDSGEGNFEFDTKQGNGIFQYVESAINQQRAGLSQRQGSYGTLDRDTVPQASKPTPPTEVYSTVTEGGMKEVPKQTSPYRSRLETPTDKHLTGVKSLNLDVRPAPRKNQVKNFRSCPLTSTEDETYSRVTVPVLGRDVSGNQEEQSQKQSPRSSSEDPEYSLPFDNISKNIMLDILLASHSLPSIVEPCSDGRKRGSQDSTEPLYDSIDESAITSTFSRQHKRHPGSYRAMEHIYDEPEGFAIEPGAPTSVYDDPAEVKGNAWQLMGSLSDPSGHEYPYNAQVDDYAVPKPPRRALMVEQERGDGQEDDCSPYDNVLLKMKSNAIVE